MSKFKVGDVIDAPNPQHALTPYIGVIVEVTRGYYHIKWGNNTEVNWHVLAYIENYYQLVKTKVEIETDCQNISAYVDCSDNLD